MQNIAFKFEGSPQKFGKAAFCDLFYTQSKLYDHVLYKDLISFKDVWNYKAEALVFQALKQHLEDKYSYALMEKNTIIQTQQQEISFLQQKNRDLANKNIERVNRILKDHKETISKLLKQKEEQVFVIQSQKQLLQNRIGELENELTKNANLFNNIQRERQQMSRKEKQLQETAQKFQFKAKQLETAIQEMQKEHKLHIKKLNQQKLQIELHFKKMMVEHSQDHKQQISDLERSYEKKLELLEEQKLHQSLAAKQTLNRALKNYETKFEQNKLQCCELQELVQKLTKQLDLQKRNNFTLAEDIKKQDEILDKYEVYLKQSDENIIKLKQLLLQCQEQLQKAKVSLQKNQIEKDSFLNRMKICEQEARMWRQSYYLNKSRAFIDN